MDSINQIDHPVYHEYLDRKRLLEKISIENQKLEYQLAQIPINAKKELLHNRTQTRQKNNDEINYYTKEIRRIEEEHDDAIQLIQKLSEEMPAMQLEKAQKAAVFEDLEDKFNDQMKLRFLKLAKYNKTTAEVWEKRNEANNLKEKCDKKENDLKNIVQDLKEEIPRIHDEKCQVKDLIHQEEEKLRNDTTLKIYFDQIEEFKDKMDKLQLTLDKIEINSVPKLKIELTRLEDVKKEKYLKKLEIKGDR
jgi:DNA repair exonuclease SbcCD ATPase subunit